MHPQNASMSRAHGPRLVQNLLHDACYATLEGEGHLVDAFPAAEHGQDVLCVVASLSCRTLL